MIDDWAVRALMGVVPPTVSLPNNLDQKPAPIEETQRIKYALAHGYKQDGAWWIHPDGTRTSVDGLPKAQGNEWDVCPVCQLVTRYCRGH